MNIDEQVVRISNWVANARSEDEQTKLLRKELIRFHNAVLNEAVEAACNRNYWTTDEVCDMLGSLMQR